MFLRSRSRSRLLGYVGLFGITLVTMRNLKCRYDDFIVGSDSFSLHSIDQQRKHPFSGMHQPFITNNCEELKYFEKYFSSQYSFLFVKDLNILKEKHSLKSPVKFESLSKLSNNKLIKEESSCTLVVGGPPALISAVYLVKKEKEKEKDLIYINDQRRIPISNGSAWHLEQDAQTEAPTNYKPTYFLVDQIKRLLFQYVYLKDIQQTGNFPWRTIDWIQWIRHPDHWYRAIKLSLLFEWNTIFVNRFDLLNDVSKQCFLNEIFFDELDKELDEKILLKGNGSIIIARNAEEVVQLNNLKNGLIDEGRNLNILSKEEMKYRYGFIPNGISFGEKVHDRVLVPNFMNILKKFLLKEGGKVIDGRVEIIFKDENEIGGIAQIKNVNGEINFIKFSRLILSLGNQIIEDKNGKRLFDVVSARGVSVLAHVYLKKGSKLPPVLVCGGTNHATKLSSQPIDFNSNYDLYLMRFTGGACITPNICDEQSCYYDGTIALGLIESIKKCLGNENKVEPIFVYGCNRQVSKYGQITWIQPLKQIYIQYGAAGGGLTRAPDFITKIKKYEIK